MQNDKEAADIIDNLVNNHVYDRGEFIGVATQSNHFHWKCTATCAGSDHAARVLFEIIFKAGMALGRRRTIDEITKASADAFTKACADYQAAADDREQKKRALESAESEARVQEIMVEKAKKAGAAVYEILKTIESK